ncbi:hypothetical protein H0H92_007853 [Tricholoma furcatifolium]|nr:hypothetical protein H0H92_007853 [Tricholoma furcatifolium]
MIYFNNASAFFDLISSPSTTTTTNITFAPYIRHIEAKDNCESGRWLNDNFTALQPRFLPSLKSISLLTSDYLSPNTLSALRSFDRLTELRLSECHFQDFSHLQTLLCAFPALESLYLEANWPEPSIIAPTDASPSSHLRKVYLRCDIAHVLEWFLMQPVFAPVSELTLHSIDENELPVVSMYLQTLGSALTSLTIVPGGALYDSLPNHINLSFSPCLRFIKLAIDCDSANMRMVHTLLSPVESPMEEVELSFYSVRRGNDVDRHWEDLDTLLTTPRFASIRRTTISAFFSHALARETLPLCEGRGILRARRL